MPHSNFRRLRKQQDQDPVLPDDPFLDDEAEEDNRSEHEIENDAELAELLEDDLSLSVESDIEIVPMEEDDDIFVEERLAGVRPGVIEPVFQAVPLQDPVPAPEAHPIMPAPVAPSASSPLPLRVAAPEPHVRPSIPFEAITPQVTSPTPQPPARNLFRTPSVASVRPASPPFVSSPFSRTSSSSTSSTSSRLSSAVLEEPNLGKCIVCKDSCSPKWEPVYREQLCTAHYNTAFKRLKRKDRMAADRAKDKLRKTEDLAAVREFAVEKIKTFSGLSDFHQQRYDEMEHIIAQYM